MITVIEQRQRFVRLDVILLADLNGKPPGVLGQLRMGIFALRMKPR